ncbi:MAG: hypothetical protein M3Q08_01080 [Pseudomonadota bacterium]|nr:hypothetical protein [Pseudomonadota bacterium]
MLMGDDFVRSLHEALDAKGAPRRSEDGNVIFGLLQRIDALPALRTPSVDVEKPPFQQRVQPWMGACFGAEISSDMVERGDRLLEEVLELLQTGGYDFGRVVPLRDYVAARPAGEPSQEVGGVMVTLAAYCLAAGLDMHSAGETELARIWTCVEKIRAKQAAKPKHSPLPIALTTPPAKGADDNG